MNARSTDSERAAFPRCDLPGPGAGHEADDRRDPLAFGLRKICEYCRRPKGSASTRIPAMASSSPTSARKGLVEIGDQVCRCLQAH
jgi:hypothetical protein